MFKEESECPSCVVTRVDPMFREGDVSLVVDRCKIHRDGSEGYDDLCTAFGRPVAQESENGGRVELRTHSETILLGDDDALELADEIVRIVEGHETENKETGTDD